MKYFILLLLNLEILTVIVLDFIEVEHFFPIFNSYRIFCYSWLTIPHKPVGRGDTAIKLWISSDENVEALLLTLTSKLLIRLVTRQYCFRLVEYLPLQSPLICE